MNTIVNNCPRVSQFDDGGRRKMKRNGMKTGWKLIAMFALALFERGKIRSVRLHRVLWMKEDVLLINTEAIRT